MFMGYEDGACHYTQNLDTVAWAIYNLSCHLVSSGGVSLSMTTHNTVGYIVLIDLFLEAISLDI